MNKTFPGKYEPKTEDLNASIQSWGPLTPDIIVFHNTGIPGIERT